MKGSEQKVGASGSDLGIAVESGCREGAVAALEAENLVLRHQINVLRRAASTRPRFGNIDRSIFIGVYQFFPHVRDALAIVQPATVIRSQRAGFRAYWQWKSRPRGGRPKLLAEFRRLIRDMGLANPLWGAPIHGELLKLGYRADERGQIYGAAQKTAVPGLEDVSAQLCRWHRRDGPVRGSDDFFGLLYGLLIPYHDRRRIMWIGMTAHPTVEWIARQLVEACGWEQVPRYILRDRDDAYGVAFTRRIRAMGIRDRTTAPQSPWQNAYTERLIGSIRRDCTDHVVVLGERHLRHILLSYMNYYNATRTHLSLDRSHVRCRPLAGFCRGQFSVDCTTNISGFDFR